MAILILDRSQNPVIKFITEYLKEQAYHVLKYEDKVKELDKVVDKLQGEGARVRNKAQEEEDRYGREIYDDVTKWLDGVDEIISEYDKFTKEDDCEHAGCYLGFPPNLAVRYRRSKTADDIIGKVNRLLQTKHDDISRWGGPPSMGVAFSNVDYQPFESRTETLEEIMKALKNPVARMIGVHGLAGVGKTTLVIEAANKAREEKLFNVVIMANVTKRQNIRKIQGQIADFLGMKLEEESEHARAVRIQERLQKEKENTLIILDDLCAKVDLNMLGIPNGDGSQMNLKERKSPAHGDHNKMMETEQPKKTEKLIKLKTEERFKGCKILLISEVRQVLSQMNVKASFIFKVDVLNGKEAEILFKKMAGIDNTNSESEEKLAAEIAKKCNSLPMSIVTTARALKNHSPSVWEDARRKLERQKLTGTPEYSTKLSYKLLDNEELKLIFLLCARMGNDALVADLVRYCIGLGFLQDIYTVREARDRVQTLLVKLKEYGLLSDSYSSDHFTMQNLVRNAALSIASEENHVFTLTEGKLDEWPDEDKLKRYTAFSLRHCDVIDDFPKSIKCPRLRVFHVDNNVPRLKIPDSFFQQMKELRVLILTGIDLSQFPSSIGCLTKLRMLCLEQCILGEELKVIGKLKNLRILSFSGSDILSLPVELKHLSKLQIFDISNCTKLRVIPRNVISSLTCLEELYMRNVSITWRVDKAQESQSENASLSELGHLNQLTSLDIQIPSDAHLPKSLFFYKLHSYQIVIGSLDRYLEPDFKVPEKYGLLRFLAIVKQQNDGFDIHSQKGLKMLFGRVENLLLEKLNGVRDIFYELNLKGFPYLKHLSIVRNSDIQSLISPKDRKHREKAFPKLESLVLYKLKNMKEISSCELSEPSFGKLKTIKIKLCGQLKNVCLISIARLLTALETVEVSECDSLKEIVTVEIRNDDEPEVLQFLELRSLTLQSLPVFIGIYPTPSAGETRILFEEKVIVPKLERMELSIPIDQIWIGQSSSFQNLIHLDVNDCRKLKYLLSFSMIENLRHLQSLSIRKCSKMKNIFLEGQGSDAKMKRGNIFPNLKNIKLSSMKSLSELWNSEVPADSFGKLDTLIIEKCDKLVNVFPCYIAGIFQSLSILRVTNCKSMKVIFQLADKKPGAKHVTHLQDVHFETLPKLEHVFKLETGQGGILNLNDLQKIWVNDCDSLESIFPVSVAKTLENLEYLVVQDCFRLRELVAEEGDGIEFEFPKLTTIKFSRLPKFTSFYKGAYKLSCSKLSDLSVELCDKLELFREETANASVREENANAPIRDETAVPQMESILFPDEVINKLKSMQIELRHAKSLTHYRWDNLEELHLSRLNNTDILYSFLHRNPNIRSLRLDNCFFEVLVPPGMPPGIESLGVVPKLRSLKLTDLHCLTKIGFERDAILQRIELLILKNCPRLDSLAPSSVSLTHLTNLEVDDCGGLKYLMLPWIAKSLGQLSTMKVINCASLEEIVSEEGREEDENASQLSTMKVINCASREEIVSEEGKEEDKNASKVVIAFGKLKALELVSLKNLKCFCSSKSCVFEFPSLEKFVVSACPKMEKFAQEVKRPPILQKIYVVHTKEKKRSYWEGDLESTIQKIFKDKKFFEGMERISVSDHLDLQQVWQGKGLENLPRQERDRPPKDWFYSLKTLKLENCKFETYAIPSHVLRRLKSLKELEVRNCKKITVIFEMNDPKIWQASFQLKRLALEGLRNVTHIWQQDEQGILSFQNLQNVTVLSCKKLKTLFPAALAKNLNKLESLAVEFCDELLEIVGKELEAAEGTERFVFPHLTWLDLYKLPQLTHFYSERFTLECPELNDLSVIHCNKFELFQSQQEPDPPSQGSTSIIRQPLFLDTKGISKVEYLHVSWKDSSLLRSWLGQCEDEDLQYLNSLFLYMISDDDVNENSTFPFEILQKIPNLEAIGYSYCRGLKEIFSSQTSEISKGVLGNLKRLFLYTLFELHSISSLSELHMLCVCHCPRLTTLVQSGSNLKEIYIGECHGLQCLFTSSVAKMLRHLEEIDVEDCESMKEIVGKEQDETATGEIKFERLERISLGSLSSLECFYSGNATLQLLSLIQVDIVQCPKMIVFSESSIYGESFKGIQFSYNSNDDLVFHHDLNATLKTQFLHQTKLVLGDYPELEEKWLVPIPSDWSFSKLKSLVVEGCKLDAILPSHLLPILNNLEELVVRKCDSVMAIFDVKDTTTNDSNMIVIPLKKLTLEQLPTLRHVWNEDPKGRLSILVLEEVIVNECKSLTCLFTASVAKDNLQKLDVRNCDELEEIVAKDEVPTEEANKKLAVFPKLTSLTLWNLPKLRYICSGMDILDWPKLEDLDVRCRELKIFAADSYPEGQDHLTTNKHAYVSASKVTPNLEELSLNKEDVRMIEEGLLHVDLQKIKSLRLQRFDEDSDAFPDDFFLKVPLPSMEMFGVIDCAFKEIFHSQMPDIDYTKILSQLKGLMLKSLHKLNSVGLEHTWMAPLENLEDLEVLDCSSLTNLVSSTVSFVHLTGLHVKDCARLEYLFTSSTARSLVALHKMSITNCESLEKVMAEEGDKPDEDVIFANLFILSLDNLPKLGSFYTGNSTLNFPWLNEVSFTQCKNMKTFSPGNVIPKIMQGKIDGVRWYGDLNTAVDQQFKKGSSLELA